MSILDEIDKGIALQPAGGFPPPPLDRAAKDSLLARIRQTYPAAVQAAAAGTAQQPAVAPTNPNHKEAGPTPASPPDAKPAPFVTAVWEPPGFRGQNDPGGYFFDESVSQAERKRNDRCVDWFDRAAARKKREAAKNSGR